MVSRAVRKNNLYELTALIVSSGVGISKVWHERFGHLSYPILLEMQKTRMVTHLPALSKVQEPCEACMMGKQQRKAFPHESDYREKAPLQLVHADLSGKAPTQALGGCDYYMLIVATTTVDTCGCIFYEIRLKLLENSNSGKRWWKTKAG